MTKKPSEHSHLEIKERVLINKKLIDDRIKLLDIKADCPLYHFVVSNREMHQEIANLIVLEPYDEWQHLHARGFLSVNERFDFNFIHDRNLLHIIAENKDAPDIVEKIHFLYEQKVSLDAVDSWSLPPLWVSIMKKNEKAALALIDRKANIHFVIECADPRFKMTPWLLAAREGEVAIIKRMIKKANPKLNEFAHDGMSALHFAAKAGYQKVVTAITEAKHIRNYSIDFLDFERYTPLHYAAQSGHQTICSHLLEKKADPNFMTAYDQSSIHLAFLNADHKTTYSIVELLLMKGGYLNKMGERGNTPLHLAARQGNSPLVKMLLGKMRQFDIDPEIKNDFGETPLYYAAAFSDDVEMVRLLDEKDSKSSLKIRPAHEAAACGRMSVVKYFVEEKNFLIEEADSRGYTLIFAAILGEVDLNLVDYLVEIKANLEHKEEAYGRTPLFYAAEGGNRVLVQKLLDKKANVNALDCQNKNVLFALIKGWSHATRHHGLVQSKKIDDRYIETFQLLEKYIDIHAQDNNGINLIFIAAYWNNLNAILFLIDQGVNPWLVSKIGETPYSLAWRGQFGKIEYKNKYQQILFHLKNHLLINSGIHVPKEYLRIPNNFNSLLLNINKNAPIIQWLIEGGADVNCQLAEGKTAVFFASESKNIEMLNFFLQRGAKIDLVDHYGRPPFFKQLEFLESKGINTIKFQLVFPLATKLELYEQFPLHEAVKNGQDWIVEVLLNKGVDPNIEDNRHRRPLDYARDNESIRKLLMDHKARDSVIPNFKLIKQQVVLQETPIIWLADLTIIFSLGNKPGQSIEIPADIHKDLRNFENLFRRRVENERVLRSSGKEKKEEFSAEALHNRPQGEVIESKDLPNYAVAAISLVGFAPALDQLVVTLPIPLKVEDEQRNIWHVIDFLKSNITRQKDFLPACQEYANEAQNIYKKMFGIEIHLDTEQPVNFEDHRKTHHSERALYEYLEQNIAKIIKNILDMASEGFRISAGFMIYALIIDLYTTREMCGNCIDRTIGMQNLDKSGRFKSNLISALRDAELNCPASGIKIITRISYDHPSTGTPHVPAPDDKNGKDNGSRIFAHENSKKRFQDDYKYTLIRCPLDINDLANSVVLASPQKHTADSLGKRPIEATVCGKYSIFSSKSPTSSEQEVYEQLFKFVPTKRQSPSGSTSAYGLLPDKKPSKKIESKPVPVAKNEATFS